MHLRLWPQALDDGNQQPLRALRGAKQHLSMSMFGGMELCLLLTILSDGYKEMRDPLAYGS